jgi:L,D-peptidoglycan transpeptidase YkuD (ErfK/YbiS/YcfS/YnhG family)
MDIVVSADGVVSRGGWRVRCALGRGGIRADKREGDGATPTGRFPLGPVYFRPDRLAVPLTGLPVQPIHPALGWCDDAAEAAYNSPVRLPFSGRHERMWRDDGLYDLLAVIGYNMHPIVPGLGSAIFLHLAKANYEPTEGCVALALPDLQALLADCSTGAWIRIERQ